jgi:hypothetical protein
MVKTALSLLVILSFSTPSQAGMTKMNEPFFACRELDVYKQIHALGQSSMKTYEEVYRQHQALGECRYIGPAKPA